MAITTTNVFSRNLECYLAGHDFIINQGSSGSSKNYSILYLLHEIATAYKSKTIHIVSISMPHLKDGAITDFKDVLGDLFETGRWNDTDKIYYYNNKSKIKFMSVDKLGKATGPRRDILYLNEANNIPFNIVQQLFLRTRECIFIDFNPAGEFWLHNHYPGFENLPSYIHSTYRDNEYLPEKSRREIERLKDIDEYLWKVYGLGELGLAVGLIYPNWKTVSEFPSDGEFLGYWLDFGFTNDPTACGKMSKINGELYVQELFYKTGLTNTINIENPQQDSIENKLNRHGVSKDDIIIADSAERKSIRELRLAGFNIVGVQKKSADDGSSVIHGINILKKWSVNIVDSSLNIIKEQRNYKWMVHSKTDELINKPVKAFDHHMDGIRYLCMYYNKFGTL